MQSAVDGDVLDLVHHPFARTQLVRTKDLDLLGLLLLDDAAPGWLRRLGHDGDRESRRNDERDEELEYSETTHGYTAPGKLRYLERMWTDKPI
jgi:hypothetical protein